MYDNDQKILKNKICLMSFNKSKGLEKKNVFVFFLDEYYDKICDEIDNYIPNSLYVALTRSL